MSADLIDAAIAAMAKAHAPYSKFCVGAALRGASGKVYAGCNVENASYPEGCCAETSAISALVMGGEARVVEVAVAGAGDMLVTPCGGCRQRLREFADAGVEIHICGPQGLRKTVTLGELLPLSFGPDHLKG
ncbi:MAG: cytidine deaminase [Kiloniellaceae bacterium]